MYLARESTERAFDTTYFSRVMEIYFLIDCKNLSTRG
jgi:hypothetical protein